MKTVLVTGGDSYLGGKIARLYLRETDLLLNAWIHAQDEAEFTRKRQKAETLFAEFAGRVDYSWGDLTDVSPFRQVSAESICHIVHPAAVTRFNVDETTARQVNIEGTEKLLAFAESCPNLQRLGFVSTIYASGLRSGAVPEQPLDDAAGFANFYEWSKWSAEQVLLKRYSHLPWQIFRTATVIADDDTGRVIQQNAVHNTLKLLYYGLLSLVPGRAETPVYLVTGDFIARAVFDLLQHASLQNIYHVCNTQSESVTLGELLEVTFETFSQDTDFKARRIMKPLLCDEESFDLMAGAVTSFGGDIVSQALKSVSPFARQLYITKDIRNDHLMCEWPGYVAPDNLALVRRTCGELVRTKWGRDGD